MCGNKDLFCSSVGSLSHLRYLGVTSIGGRYDPSDQLPVDIGKLRFLQTLDLSGITRVKELSSSIIIGLEQLRYLRAWFLEL